MKNRFILGLLITFALSSCGQQSPVSSAPESAVSESSSSLSSSEIENKALKFFSSNSLGTPVERPSSLPSFAPKLFDKDSLSIENSRKLGEGVNHLVYSFNLNSGNNVKANVIAVDMQKASIHTTSAGTIDTVNNQISAYETAHPDKKVMAGVNADFFPTGTGGSCVNAYVKDGKIIKAGHNDNGVYDYRDPASDVPASNPMLLGVDSIHARIAPIVENKTKEETIKSKFQYTVYSSDQQDTPKELDGKITFNASNIGTADYDLVINGTKYVSEENQTLVKIHLINDSEASFVYGQVEEVRKLQGERISTSLDLDKGYVYLFAKEGAQRKFATGDYVGYAARNDDGKWFGYSNIIGGRQSLVEQGEIPSTVALENTNGAQRTNIPRTCAGIACDSTLYVVAIEALRYGNKSTSTSDPYGVSLPELAEFMRYIGCYEALNFDGGGSTQLITSDKDGTGTKTLSVRSSDYGTYDVNEVRKVYNTLLITTK
ncbi:MAG: phosphodiester glycosidase family protein [Bacilli bacterium]|nr:phosphodiester glycosidase family protein [Bacilli bacterium]